MLLVRDLDAPPVLHLEVIAGSSSRSESPLYHTGILEGALGTVTNEDGRRIVDYNGNLRVMVSPSLLQAASLDEPRKGLKVSRKNYDFSIGLGWDIPEGDISRIREAVEHFGYATRVCDGTRPRQALS